MPSFYFEKKHAIQYGVEEAIMLENFLHWIAKNKANNHHHFDNRFWTYNSVKAFHKVFSFWTPKQIQRILKSLINQKIIMTGNYNKAGYDKTKWYALVNEDAFLKDFVSDDDPKSQTIVPNSQTIDLNSKTLCPNSQMDVTETANGFDQTVEPIPYNKPYSNPVNKPNNKQQHPDVDVSTTKDHPEENTMSLTAERSEKNPVPISPAAAFDIAAEADRYFSNISAVSEEPLDFLDKCLTTWMDSVQSNYPDFKDRSLMTETGLGKNRSILGKIIPKLKNCFSELAHDLGINTTDSEELFLDRFKNYTDFVTGKDETGQYYCFAVGKNPVLAVLRNHLDECNDLWKYQNTELTKEGVKQ